MEEHYVLHVIEKLILTVRESYDSSLFCKYKYTKATGSF